MYSTDQIRDAFLKTGILSDEQFQQACDYAIRQRVEIDEALVALELATFEELGRGLEMIYSLPYRPTEREASPQRPWKALSPECASHWRVVPLEYDEQSRTLTVAVSSLDAARRLEHAFSLLMTHDTLAFTIAPQVEIESTLSKLNSAMDRARRLRAKAAVSVRPAPQRPQGRAVPYGPRIVRQYDDVSDLELPSEAPRIGSRTDKKSAPEKEPGGYIKPAEDLRKILIDVAQKVSEHLSDSSSKLERVRAKVRYSHLLCARLAMEPKRTQRTVLAAWLAAFGKNSDMPAQLGNPAKVISVLKTPPAHRMPLIEQRVLSLIDKYLDLVTDSPDVVRNQNVLQSDLRPSAMAGDEGQLVLGTFLELLRDERFLSETKTARASVLIIDGAEFSAPTWSPTLARDGFQVESVPTLTDARRILAHSPQDVLLIAAHHPDGEGLEFCREMRRAASCPSLVGILPHSPPPTSEEFVEAGADQTWSENIPISQIPERIQRLASNRKHTKLPEGLQGNLSQLNLVDMVQILSAAAQDMRISLRKAGREGHVYMQKGELICAELDSTQGEDALFELLSWSDGDFSASACKSFPPKNLSGDTLGLLMEAARVADEARANAEGVAVE